MIGGKRCTRDRTHLQVTFTLAPKKRSRQRYRQSQAQKDVTPGNIPRVSRLLALAIRFQDMLARGEVEGYADLARLGYVSRARITQIMNLTLLAPDIQEEILFLPRTVKGRDPIKESDLRSIAAVPLWNRQRKMWKALLKERISTA